MIRISGAHIGHTKILLKSKELELKRGSIYVLVGKNGSGKTTLLQTISGQLPVLSGEIELGNRKLNQVSKKEIPTLLSFVPVHFPDMDYVQAQEYIAAGRSPYTNIFGKLSTEDIVLVNNALDTLQINHLKNRFTSELSDGEKQLVAIAKVIAQEAPYILLDEPTAFLDYPNKNKVLELLSRIAKKMNKCILLSAHDIDLCLEHCENFLVVNKDAQSVTLMRNPTKEALVMSAFG